MAKAPSGRSAKSAGHAGPAVDAQVQLLMGALSDLVLEMIEAKCKTITNRERQTLERRIEKAIRLFVQGR